MLISIPTACLDLKYFTQNKNESEKGALNFIKLSTLVDAILR